MRVTELETRHRGYSRGHRGPAQQTHRQAAPEHFCRGYFSLCARATVYLRDIQVFRVLNKHPFAVQLLLNFHQITIGIYNELFEILLAAASTRV